MTRQLTSAVRHKLLRSPHAKRPPHGRLRSSRLLASDWSVTPGAFIGPNPTDESIVSGLPVILDNIHFGQGRASRIRFSGEISKQESEYASPRLRFEKRLDGIVFRQESADKQAAEDGRRVRRGALASVSIHADGHGTFLALRF